jgi:hypothetical protein
MKKETLFSVIFNLVIYFLVIMLPRIISLVTNDNLSDGYLFDLMNYGWIASMLCLILAKLETFNKDK